MGLHTGPSATVAVAPRPKATRWVVFAVLGLGYFFAFFHRFATAVIAGDLVRDFGLSSADLGLLGSAYFYPYAAMQIPAGALADRLGTKKTAAFSLLLAGVGSFLFTFTRSFPLAVLGRALIGLGISCVYVPSLKTLGEWFDRREFATVSGTFLAIGNVGGLMASMPLAVMVARLGWRPAYGVMSVITASLALLVWVFVRDSVAAAVDEPRLSLGQGLREVFTSRNIWLVSLWGFCFSGIRLAFQSLWAGQYLTKAAGMGMELASTAIFVLGLGSVFGNPLVSRLELMPGSRKTKTIAVSVIYSLSWSLLAFYPGRMSFASAAVIMGWIGLTAGCYSLVMFFAREATSPQVVGTALGVFNCFIMFGGAVMTQVQGVMVGYLTKLMGDQMAYRWVFGIDTVLMLAATALLTFLIPQPAHK
ncbi:MAG: MFS transporter [Bacillota bacterium]